jgi:hypothetical protein
VILTPVTVTELLAQLVLGCQEEILSQIQSLRNILWVAKAEVLPWPDVMIAKILGKDLDDAEFDQRIHRALNHCFAADDARMISDDAVALRYILDAAKDRAVNHLKRVMISARQSAPPTKDVDNSLFVHSIASRVDANPDAIPVNEVIERLSAYHAYECEKIRVAVETKNYKPENHRNDLLDANQLVYLADARLRFLTTDRGFRKARTSSQFNRIHLVPEAVLRDQGEATLLLAMITETSL